MVEVLTGVVLIVLVLWAILIIRDQWIERRWRKEWLKKFTDD